MTKHDVVPPPQQAYDFCAQPVHAPVPVQGIHQARACGMNAGSRVVRLKGGDSQGSYVVQLSTSDVTFCRKFLSNALFCFGALPFQDWLAEAATRT